MQQTYNCTLCLTSSLDTDGWLKSSCRHRCTPHNNSAHIIQGAGWAPRALQDGCEKPRPTPTICPQTVQPVNVFYTNYGIMAVLDAITGTISIVDSFKVGLIFLSLRIAQRSISPLSQHTTLCIALCGVVLF